MSIHVRPLVGRLVGRRVCHKLQKNGGKFHFHVPIGALVYRRLCDVAAAAAEQLVEIQLISTFQNG